MPKFTATHRSRLSRALGKVDVLVPVTESALIQRINRKLAPEQVLKVARGSRALQDLGQFYVLDVSGNFVVDKDVDVTALGRKLGVLRPFEKLAEKDDGR
jgi:hypothetical protein